MASYFEIMDNINKSRNTPGGYRGMGQVPPTLQDCTLLPFAQQYQCSLANDALIQSSGGHVYWSGPMYTSSVDPNTGQPLAPVFNNGINFTTPRGGSGSTLYPGDVWTIDIYGQPGQTVSNHVVFPDGGTSSTPNYGQTDASGHWAITGTIANEQAGLWQETWSVGNQVVGFIAFTVSRPQSAPPPPPPAPPAAPPKQDNKPPSNPFSQPPATPPAPPHTYNMTINFATNRGGNTLYVGDTWQITIAGAPPNTQVTNTVGTSTTPYGNTDANGNWSLSGTFGPTDIATWSETWKVGGTIAGSWNFVVLAAPAANTSGTTSGNTSTSTSTSVADTSSGQVSNTGQASDSTALGTTFEGMLTQSSIISGVPNWALLAGAALVIIMMSQGSGGGGYRR